MRGSVLIAAGGLLAIGAWLLTRSEQEPGSSSAPGDVLADVGQVVGNVTEEALQGLADMAGLSLSRMRTVTADDVGHPNVRAVLAVIRRGEGTAGENGYRTLFGGGLFDGFADHPRRSITRKMGSRNITSTAAGAYQFLSSTWDETARIMGLRDFTPASQDRAAVGRIAARGALNDVKAGRLADALKKIGWEWASMPGSPYGQPVITAAAARSVFQAAGGVAVG